MKKFLIFILVFSSILSVSQVLLARGGGGFRGGGSRGGFHSGSSYRGSSYSRSSRPASYKYVGPYVTKSGQYRSPGIRDTSANGNKYDNANYIGLNGRR